MILVYIIVYKIILSFTNRSKKSKQYFSTLELNFLYNNYYGFDTEKYMNNSMNILCLMRGENNLKVYYLALSLFLTFFFAHQITHVMCFGRYRDKKCKKIKFYFIYGFWVVFLEYCVQWWVRHQGGSYIWLWNELLRIVFGQKNYFEGNVIYAEDDYKHNGDFILEYYVKIQKT